MDGSQLSILPTELCDRIGISAGSLVADLRAHATYNGQKRSAGKCFTAIAVVLSGAATALSLLANPALSQTQLPLQLEAKIPLGEVRGRIDHLAFDNTRQRVLVAELGNNSVAIVDLKERMVVRTLVGFKEPQGVAYVPATDTLYVSNAGDGSVRLFNAGDHSEITRIGLGDDADNIRLDNAGHQLFVGYGNGALAVIDVLSKKKIADIQLKAHPESFQLSGSGSLAFVNVPKAREIAVIDRAAGKQTASWRVTQNANFPMAIHEAAQQVLVVFRSPAQLGVFASTDGKVAATAETCGDADDIFVDVKRQRVYIACGAGFLDVFDAARYRRFAHIPTIEGARTALFIPEMDRLVLAARATASEPASIWVFRPMP
jgi:DNA-binding beta-propeller fold protein YncE